jgi:hypothetical protein
VVKPALKRARELLISQTRSEEFDWHRIVPKQINGARDELSQGIDKFHPPSAKRIFEKDNRAKVKKGKNATSLSAPLKGQE